jgi:transketolase
MKTQRDALIEEIHISAADNKDIYFLSADFGAPALDAFRDNLPQQFFHLGISEQNMIDVAIGLALKGKTVFTYAMAPFISLRCAEQHKIAAMMNLQIVNIISGVGLSYANAGPTHYSTEDYSLAYNTIGSEVYTMADAITCTEFVRSIIKNPRFSFVRLDRDAGTDLSQAVNFEEGYRVIGSGKRACFVTHGYFAQKLSKLIKHNPDYQDVVIIDVFRSKPVSEKCIKEILSYDKIVFVDEQISSSSIGCFLAQQELFKSAGKNFKSICLADKYMFENSGRDSLIQLAGITDDILLSSVS